MLLKGNIGSIFLISCLSFTHFLIENDHMFIQGLNNNIFQKSRKKKIKDCILSFSSGPDETHCQAFYCTFSFTTKGIRLKIQRDSICTEC